MGEAKRRLFAQNGLVHDAVHDPDAERMVIKTSQDVEPILDSVARDRELTPSRAHNGMKVGTLPAVVVIDLMNRGIFYDDDAFNAWWNSFEADPWRSWGRRT